ncbi:MAG: zinc-binding dehydrogenase, partial [Chloroflexota bacterium]|nr:zinc-binding dehydrogenase [Chloroflexota bacterium]
KAVRLIEPGQPLEMEEIPVPEIGPRDVLVRVKAAGICHSDVHYRAGVSPVYPLPLTLGHEVAGVIKQVGAEVAAHNIGDRVCLHYMVTCGDCVYCSQGSEQFCTSGQMLGKNRDGGYAEYIRIPARNAFPLPQEISFEQGAIMMCSSATSFHALRKGRVSAGETVAVFGVGGLGMSAVQLAQILGALDTYAVDINAGKLKTAEGFGAIPIDAAETDPVDEIKRLTDGRGVDVALELIGLPLTVRQCIESLAVFGRAVMVGLSDKPSEFSPYRELICREAELIGSADHLAHELPALIELVRRGTLDLSGVVTSAVPLDAGAVNETMDRLEHFGGGGRVVITP